MSSPKAYDAMTVVEAKAKSIWKTTGNLLIRRWYIGCACGSNPQERCSTRLRRAIEQWQKYCSTFEVRQLR